MRIKYRESPEKEVFVQDGRDVIQCCQGINWDKKSESTWLGLAISSISERTFSVPYWEKRTLEQAAYENWESRNCKYRINEFWGVGGEIKRGGDLGKAGLREGF